MKRTPFDQLPYVPAVLAEMVCMEPYEGQEFSNRPSQNWINGVEAKRQTLTPRQMQEFAAVCEEWCRESYEARAKWFMKILRMKDGRDQLMLWFRHWMVGCLRNGIENWKRVHDECRKKTAKRPN